jgi:MFS family permease
VFPIAVVAMLVGIDGISDQIGRRAAMLLGLGASLIGALLFAVAPDVWWVFAGRAFMGVGVGLSAGPSTAAILEFCGHQDAKRAASLTITAQAAGFAAGLLVGGALTEYGPWPTRLCFWVLAVLLLVLLAATWHLPRHTIAGENGGWRPKMPFVPKDLRRAFATASTAMMTAYTTRDIPRRRRLRPRRGQPLAPRVRLSLSARCLHRPVAGYSFLQRPSRY